MSGASPDGWVSKGSRNKTRPISLSPLTQRNVQQKSRVHRQAPKRGNQSRFKADEHGSSPVSEGYREPEHFALR